VGEAAGGVVAVKNQDTLASVLGEESGRAQPSNAGADDNDVVNSKNVVLLIRDSDVHRSLLQRISVRRPVGQLNFPFFWAGGFLPL
jgi:hypothetical protein